MNRRLIKCFIAVIIMCTAMSVPAGARSAQAKSSVGVVNTDGLNIRSGAGTGYAVVTHNGAGIKLNTGAKVNILGEYFGGWYKVSFTYSDKSYTGYAASMYVTRRKGKEDASDIHIPASVTTAQKVSVKAKSGAAYLKSGGKNVKLKKGKKVTVNAVKKTKKATWYSVEFDYKGQMLTGYVNSGYVKINKTQAAAYTLKKTPIRKKAGTTSYVKVKKKIVKLKKNAKITVIKEKTVKGTKWFYIKAKANKKTVKGWIMQSNIMFSSGYGEQNNSNSQTPSPTPVTALSDAEFEAEMNAQAFPESYKPYLRELHKTYPYWSFKTYNTGLDWNTAVDNESKVGKSLIPNTKAAAWKSYESGAYDYAADRYIVYDGTSWVTASRQAVAYYMDPRNFLTEKYVFMFEALAYEPQYQNADGVDKILNNTIYKGASYTYTDDAGNPFTASYKDTFIAAAALTGVSPYHLATRMKQEVVTGTSTVSSSVTGTVAGFEGIYNFYNIGASDGADGGAVIRGLTFASQGTTYMRPWNNQYKAIVGGAQYIGSNYIARGQNTLYLEKFNVTPNSTYSHQYMSNVMGAYSEAAKTYDAYKEWMAAQPIVFYIPVYNSMPDTAVAAPLGNLNPNNYLGSITVTGDTQASYQTSPAFVPDGTGTYNITVPASETGVTITAVPVNGYAKVAGTGRITLSNTVTNVPITVTAQNGNVKNYTIIITKI